MFRIHSIRPGGYQVDDGNDVPAHIHFTLQAVGYRMYASDFSFEDDALILEKGNPESIPIARIIDEGSVIVYCVRIAMQND